MTFSGATAPSVCRANFSLQLGEILAVIGESGAGKTTLARTIAGRLPPSVHVSGQVSLLGSELTETRPGAPKTTRRPRIAFIPQEPESVLNPVLRVRDQVEEVIRVSGAHSPAELRRRADAVLSLTGLPANISTAYPHQLSGGQRQRVAIAQALSSHPALLIADECASALDTVIQSEILHVLQGLTQRLQLALLFVTHNATLLPGFAQRTLVMHSGAVVECGETDQLFRAPGHKQTEKLLRAIAPLPSSSASLHFATEPQPAERVVEVTSLTKTYAAGRGITAKRHRVRALDDANLTLMRGSLVALVGKSGSGKSTLARCLARIETPDSGIVRIDGHALSSLPRNARKESRRSTQLVWQHSALALNPRLRVGEIVAEPALIKRESSRDDCYRLGLEVMGHLGLSPGIAERTPSQLSGGQRQRVALARAMVTGPSILILDEAFAGLDLPVQQEISSALLDLKSSKRLTILFITHDLLRASAIADEIAVMDGGQIVERAAPSRLFWNPRHTATQQLVGAATMSRA